MAGKGNNASTERLCPECHADRRELRKKLRRESSREEASQAIRSCQLCSGTLYMAYRAATGLCETCGEPMDTHPRCDACGFLCGSGHLEGLSQYRGHSICGYCITAWKKLEGLLGREATWQEFTHPRQLLVRKLLWKTREEESMTDERILVTNDSSLHGKKETVIAKADEEILKSVKTGEGMVTIKSIKELKKLAKAADRTFRKSQKMVQPMTEEQARVVRKFRVEEGYSRRAVAQACHDLGWGNWQPPSNQIVGMAICERAAEFFNENYREPPWN